MKLPRLYLEGEFFDYHYQLDDFFRDKARKVTFEQLSCSNLSDINSLFELLQQCPGLAEKGEEFRPKTSDLQHWDHPVVRAWRPPQGTHLKCYFQGLGQALSFAVMLHFGRGRLLWTSPFVPTGFHNEHLCFTGEPRTCTQSTQTQLISIWMLFCTRYLIHLTGI